MTNCNIAKKTLSAFRFTEAFPLPATVHKQSYFSSFTIRGNSRKQQSSYFFSKPRQKLTFETQSTGAHTDKGNFFTSNKDSSCQDLLSSIPEAGAGAHLTEQAPGGRSSTHNFSSYPRQTFRISSFSSLNIIAIMLTIKKPVHYKNIFASLLYELHENMFGLVKHAQFSRRFALPVDSLHLCIASFCRTKAPGMRKVFLHSLTATSFNFPLKNTSLWTFENPSFIQPTKNTSFLSFSNVKLSFNRNKELHIQTYPLCLA